MSESERSESYGTPMSSDDAAELEELRREAAVLREQLENAVGPRADSAAPVMCTSWRRGSIRWRPGTPS